MKEPPPALGGVADVEARGPEVSCSHAVKDCLWILVKLAWELVNDSLVEGDAERVVVSLWLAELLLVVEVQDLTNPGLTWENFKD